MTEGSPPERVCKLDRLPMTDKEWMHLFEELKAAVEEHVEWEENELFPKANALVSSTDATEILNSYKAVEVRVRDSHG